MRSSNVRYLVNKGVSSVWKNFIMSFASFSILLVSLLLVSCAALFMMNANIIMGNIEDTNEITVYIKDNTTPEQLQHVGDVMRSNGNLTDIRYYSSAEALEDFKKDMKEYAELLEYLDENPMPETYLARVVDIAEIRATVTAIESIEAVEQVKAPYDFAGALMNIRQMLTIIVVAVLVTLIIVSIVIVSNTIRASVFARRSEISIMKYVGATDSFIKLPFFVEGCFIGILAGIASWGVTWLIYDAIFSLFTDSLTLWEMFGFFNLIPFNSVKFPLLGISCLAGALLGAAGTLISMGKYLKA